MTNSNKLNRIFMDLRLANFVCTVKFDDFTDSKYILIKQIESRLKLSN